jgi:oxygen-independent coproporphyrinogen-3 oxidase
MLGLYLHIPFCSSICSYCNFNRGLFDEVLKTDYVEALAAEIRRGASFASEDDPRAADTIFLGGGTPSLLEPDEIARLIGACRDSFDLAADVEVTLETNPETVTPARLAGFLEAGVNRISFGVQSFEAAELERLGRVHSAERARQVVGWARHAGFRNMSLDLMLWLPGQSFAAWLRNVDEAVALSPDHISLYLLELYPNAPLKEAMARQAWSQAPDDEAADMYLAGLDRLEQAGFEQYEISNVARPGFLSRHNVKYWQSGDWLGFGCGAHSTSGGVRWQNVSGTRDYIERLRAERDPAGERRRLSPEERLEEALFTGLRLTAGIDRDEFRGRFGVDPWHRYGTALQSFVDEGLVWAHGSRFGLARRGMLVANEILAVFV